jgi:hypothetical protein
MKFKLLLTVLVMVFAMSTNAQNVSVRINFPVGVRVSAPGPPPFRGAIWIGPEWQWRGGRYVVVPGYWAKPRGKSMWAPGHWKKSKYGYVWVQGRWR